MSFLSIFSKKQPPEPTSVAEALAGTMNSSSTKSRNRKSDKNNSDAEQLIPEKKRARRRLVGAIVMVLAIVIGLPLVLDPEPKPISKNIAVQVASSAEQAISQQSAEAAEASGLTQSEQIEEETAQADQSSPASATSSKPSTDDTTANSKPVINENALSSTATTAKPTPLPNKSASKESATKSPDDSARALAILNGSEADSKKQKTKARVIVQIGAFATQAKVDELRGKLKSAGIKSYTQKIATSSGDKIRVRIGPFDDKESADKVKAQLAKLGLNGTVITL